MILSDLFFFFQPYADHPYLHSFPTRRSSDLSYDSTQDDLRELFGNFGPVASISIPVDVYTGRPRGFAFVKMTNIDRKSTRLNSSHLGISYAVFCLKKKKKINNRYIICNQARQ